MPRPRVVVVSSLVPHTAIPHAGGQYLKALCDLAAERADVTLLAANTEANKKSAACEGAPSHTVLVGREFGGGIVGSALGRITVTLDPRLREWDQGAAYLPFRVGLRTSVRVRRILREADVIDLQWQDSIRFLPLVRRLNRRARVVGMFHDVQSQSFTREATSGDHSAAYWHRQAARARRHERRLALALDVVAAFSEKDLHLLGDPPGAMVIRPPIVTAHARMEDTHPAHGEAAHRVRRCEDAPTVICVSYLARFENDDAARWLLTDIWPTVLDRLPGARLRLAGAGATAELVALAERTPGVELLGYVDDLEPEYERADVAVVPLRFGAGLKFKTVDALVRGVPIVTTPVGAEGITSGTMGDEDLFAGVTADPGQLAQALRTVLGDPAAHRARADRAQAWARTTFGSEAFRRAIHTAYGWI